MVLSISYAYLLVVLKSQTFNKEKTQELPMKKLHLILRKGTFCLKHFSRL